MEDVVEIIACPVCNQEVTLEDESCPFCGAEFAPGVVSSGNRAGRNVANTHSASISSRTHTGPASSRAMQMGLLGITYVLGYVTIVVANYISNGGLVNTGPEMILIGVGAVTIMIALAGAVILGKIGGPASFRFNIPLLAGFILLLPTLLFIFRI
ncbi:MAG: hypothetical protein KIY12_01885 [Thermoplasmata archaeon]|uniref:Uncharacterized protein n=1 Tax=Candidatus Sysuiplasma superficiale TaxID=2823368 RepID=A0A8J7YP74_9ARCH|nr:hypothetical protein [Candidatus Sysuiplasma superficiale]MBX8643468.1 hypothetical protein [Candidatus Sysuiplasma superficiale]MCL4346673.1 hypothetical protein [Candidatus Thermoplasmatota archaeon]